MYDYRQQLTWAKLRVGVVVTAALAVLFLAILFAGDIAKVFSPRMSIYAAFQDVKGLRAGAPVWFSGVQVGSVRSLAFTADEKIIATLSIESDVLQYLRKDSRASILTLGLLGDKYVEISVGSQGAGALQPEDVIAGVTRPEIGEELSQFVDSVERGTLGRLLQEDTLYRDLAASAKDIRRFARSLKTSNGTLKRTIEDPAVYERFLSASKSLDTFTRRLSESKGTVHKLIEDESLYKNMNAAAAKLNSVLEKIDKEEGPIGSMVSDGELKKELRATLKGLNALVKDIKKDPKKYFEFSVF
ncbi:MAG TPA: hypothetical protein DCO77_02250 [Nitrospiraceae bacterium]|nr:hypothetical protein [Nitrospiraceae bacterium]